MAKNNSKVAVLLVGGRSTRMGIDKFSMNINGKPQWEFMLEELSSFFDEVHIACRTDQVDHFQDQPLIIDQLTDIGPMGALYSTFRQLEHVSQIFFVACDLPNFNSSLSAKLHTNLTPNHDVIAPWNTGRQSAEPLAAFWSRSALPQIEAFIADKNYALFKCMTQLNVKTVEIEDHAMLQNLNRPSDL